MSNYSKAEAYDVAMFGGAEFSTMIGWGSPMTYQELWYKMLAPLNADFFYVSVWNEGGPQYTPWPPPDDEYVPPPNILPGAAYPCIVTVYDAADNIITTGKHVQFSTHLYKNTWIYFKVTQPAPNYPAPFMCYSKIAVNKVSGSAIQPAFLFAQLENLNGNIFATRVGAGNSAGSFALNIVFPEDGHSIGGAVGDILMNGVTCIGDFKAGGITVRDKFYWNPVTLAIGTSISCIRRNADGASNFWVSYMEGVTPRVRALNIVNVPDNPNRTENSPVTVSWGPFMGIPGLVDRMCARANQVLYYTLSGDPKVYRWDIINNVALPILSDNGGLGLVTDILVLPDGSVLVGYSTGTSPSAYTLRRYDAKDGNIVLRDYNFTSQSIYNRVNYGEDPAYIYIWTHESLNESAIRRVRLSDALVVSTSRFSDYEVGRLINDQELYGPTGIPGYVTQRTGFNKRYNFWISPVSFNTGLNIAGGGLIQYTGTFLPPDDEYYPIVFPPYNPPTFPGDGQPAPTPPPEIPPYPGYPWLPPPPGTSPPQIMPNELKIGGGLITIDPSNATRHDTYLDARVGSPDVQVAIKVSIRTAYLGE